MGRRYVLSTDRPETLDVGQRRDDVVRIARRHREWSVALHLGWEEADLEQEVLLRVHRRQTSQRSHYDPLRASVSKYLWVCTRSVLGHIIEVSERIPTRASRANGLAKPRHQDHEWLGNRGDWFSPFDGGDGSTVIEARTAGRVRRRPAVEET